GRPSPRLQRRGHFGGVSHSRQGFNQRVLCWETPIGLELAHPWRGTPNGRHRTVGIPSRRDSATRNKEQCEMDNEADLVERICDECVQECVKQGGAFPVTLACVAANGSALILRYSTDDGADDVSSDILADYVEGDGYELPMNIMVVDGNGRA